MRLIDADRAIEDIKERWSEFFCPECGYETAVQFIEEQETIDPVKHAKWIKPSEFSDIVCSFCNKPPKTLYGLKSKYCPHCGADMRV